MMPNAVTCSKEQLNWAIGILDELGENEEASIPVSYFKAVAVVTAVSEAAFALAEQIERLQQQVAAQARALEALRVAAKAILDHIDNGGASQLDTAAFGWPGPPLFEVTLDGPQIEALRAALRQAKEGGA